MILVVDDDADLRHLFERELTAAGYRVTLAATGAEAIERARRHQPSLVLLDLNLPDLDGVDVLRRLKDSPATARAAVLLVSGRCSERDRIAGLELGADDYIGKPFSLRELMLRVQAVHRRITGEADTVDGVRRAGRIVIDPGAFLVRVDGASVPLTVTEFRLLHALSERGGRVCTRAELEARAGGGPHVPESRVLQTHMRRLRRKLGEAGAQIETVRAVGYRLRIERSSG
ncbi:MAG: Phosphate regulon transcriptional regulatory protein PhoB (SphR) [bacterium]|nr:Phosphate regulon transcriptional regulatory protein PhoB (SphR) [bacterium]